MSRRKHLIITSIICLILSFCCFRYSADTNLGDIFLTKHNLNFFDFSILDKTKAAPLHGLSPPQNKFGFCEDCPGSLNQKLLSGMGMALFLISLFFFGKSLWIRRR